VLGRLQLIDLALSPYLLVVCNLQRAQLAAKGRRGKGGGQGVAWEHTGP
jgi:hypothetical protein